MGWWARWRGRELPARERGPAAPIDGETRDGAKHGVWIEPGDKPWKLVEAIYRAGVRQGPYRVWWKDEGWLAERGTFVDGEKAGEVEMLYQSGAVAVRAEFRAGKMHGRCVGFDEDGAQRYDREYRDDVIWAGVYDLKSSTGDHYSWRRTYRDGHPVGAWEENDFRGDPQLRAHYDDDGQLDGAWSSFHERGKPKLVGAYAHGAKVGVWSRRSPEGAVVAEIDYGGDARWRAGGAELDARDDDDLERWIALAAAWGPLAAREKGAMWFRVEAAVDKWPDDDRARACAWIAARIAALGADAPPRISYGGSDSWIAHVLRRDDDPRAALIDGIQTDHDRWHVEHLARIPRRAGQLRVLSLYEVDLDAPADVMFPDGVAWPRLERLSIQECGRLGALPARLAAAPWASALRDLALDDDAEAIADADAAALLGSPHLRGVKALHLGPIRRGPALVAAIATAPMLDTLEELTLHYPGDEPAVAAALAARATPALRELELRGEGELPRATVIGLCAKARHPALAHVELEGFELPDGLADELRRRWPAIRFSIY